MNSHIVFPHERLFDIYMTREVFYIPRQIVEEIESASKYGRSFPDKVKCNLLPSKLYNSQVYCFAIR